LVTESLNGRRNFFLLWSGQSISQIGGQLSIFALPAVAILALHASAGQVGLLQSVEFATVAILALGAGVIVDRFPRRRLMMIANAVRFVTMASLPVAFALHRLSLTQFFIVAFIGASASVLFDTAFSASMPSLLGRENFRKGNVAMTMSASAAEAIGASSAGAIVQFVGAPLAIALNCLTYALSGFSLLKIKDEPLPAEPVERSSVRREFLEGLRVVWDAKPLRAIALTSSSAYFSGAMVTTVFAIYAYRMLHLSPVMFGAIMGFGNAGLFGGLIARPMAARLGPRTTLACATALSGIAKLTFLYTPTPLLALLVGRLLLSLSGPLFNIIDAEIRVQCVDAAYFGRMNATMRTLIWGALPLGALAGGMLGDVVGIPATMMIGGVLGICSSAWLLLCPAIPRYARA
jgi:predicted MFS family arabinose efflux permease